MTSNELRRPLLSVVVLCYKAGEYINTFVPLLQHTLSERGIQYELILVANYHANELKTDTTPILARKLSLANPVIRVVAREKRGMMGWDMKSGFDATHGEIIAVIDGDGQMPPNDVVRVYEKLQHDHLDMVQTYRIHRQDGPYRLIISRVYNLVFRLLFPSISLKDINSKPKILRRAAYEKIKPTSNGWFIDAEMVIRAHEHHLMIGEIPTTFYKNPTRTSFVTMGTMAYFIKNLLSYRWKKIWK